MKTVRIIFLLICSLNFLAACEKETESQPHRPMDPWAFRSVLDRQPRMLTLALDSTFFVAYDLGRSQLYKVWKGGVTLEGTVYTDKKNVQPTSWGKAYYIDSLKQSGWELLHDGKQEPVTTVNKGYRLGDNSITLLYEIILPSGDTLAVEESPEFVRDKTGRPGLERKFKVEGLQDGLELWLSRPDSSVVLKGDELTTVVSYFEEFAAQILPSTAGQYDH